MAAGKRGTERITDINDKDVKERKCLKCTKMFLSYAPSNRICNPCKRSPEYDTGLFHDWQLSDCGGMSQTGRAARKAKGS